MKEIVVTKNFDRTKIIGRLSIDENEIPDGYNYVFAIGGKILERTCNKIIRFELMEISLIPDSNYKKFLIKNDKIKKRIKK